MKSILGFLFVLMLALNGGLYFTMRPIEKRTSDWQRVKTVPTKALDGLKAIGRYFQKLFTTPAVVANAPAANAA